MRAAFLALCCALSGLAGGHALASPCADQVAALQRRLDSPGALRVAGLEPGHSLTTGSKALPRLLQGTPSDPQLTPTREPSRRPGC
ncbi:MULTISPECIES: hypothetical protein [unclassified Methylobacterium]|uniref:hypothetical protein n=1 Tax=unclassified Methylobacterium TaxID=2615210 RepID=UPI00031A25A7|nr:MULTISPECIES: hypothetical protein [Methylobacterium]WFT80942.1 hypothetical protein QA634_03295 [Methylobacterium nodulans]